MSWNFNEMLDKCWATALQHEPEAKLYQGFATKEMKFVNCVFRGKNNTTLLVECNDEGESNLHAILSSYMDDCVIHPPIKMSQEESLKILTEHLNWIPTFQIPIFWVVSYPHGPIGTGKRVKRTSLKPLPSFPIM